MRHPKTLTGPHGNEAENVGCVSQVRTAAEAENVGCIESGFDL